MLMKKIFSVLLSVAFLLTPFAFAVPAQAATTWDVTGSYVAGFSCIPDCGGPYLHDMVLAQDGSDNVTGNGGYLAGAVLYSYSWHITSGSVVGNQINLTILYDTGAPGIVMHMTGTIAPDGTMSGVWDDNFGGERVGTWSTTSGAAVETPTACEDPVTQTFVSDTTTTVVGDGNAIAVAVIHPAWTASIPGATWIWESGPTGLDEIVGFEKVFTASGAIISANLAIASDNSYKVFIDGIEVAADPTEYNFTLATQDTHNLTANITPGLHTLRIEVKNWGTFSEFFNPAGLRYKFTVVTCPSPETAEIHGSKFWDINGNGAWEKIGEPGLGGWTINLAGTASGSQITNGTGAYGFTSLAAGSYTLSEVLQTGWIQTASPGPITLGIGEVLNDQDFGNACFVSTNGKSKGHWTNKNGETTLNDDGGDATELALLGSLNLVNKDGTAFNPNNYSELKTWLNNAEATNMAYMLSAQLAAVKLSVEADFTDESKNVVASELLSFPSIPGLSGLGIISIDDLMTAANDALVDGDTLAGDPNRAYQEALKNVLEKVATGQNIQVCDID
mgnify:CR=1 FL=1